MELKAENEYTVTEELYREGLGQIMKDEYMPSARKLLIVLAVIWGVLAYFTYFRWGRGLILVLTELAVAVFVGVWMMTVTPKKRVTQAWEAVKRSPEGLERHAMFYEDRMEVDPGGLIVNYEDVQKTLETERMLVVISNEGVGVMLLKDAYKKGDQSTVEALLKEWKR